MSPLPLQLLRAALACFVSGAVMGLLLARREKAANLAAFGCASAGSLSSLAAALLVLGSDRLAGAGAIDLWPSLLPYVRFNVNLDGLGAFFLLILSVLGFALSIYSIGYARGFFGRKSVGILGAFYCLLLLATTLVFVAANAFFFLMAWEIMALSAYCLVSFEHEQTETRKAGVLYFVMSHMGTGCLILGFLPGHRQLRVCWLSPSGRSHGTRRARRGLPSFSGWIRHQGWNCSAAYLAAGGASRGAEQRFCAHVRHIDQDRHLRFNAGVL
jgi:formate hydrogenlyase subunit 3/multisubunit Na+/H+ antiporter MnhD subunit